MKKKQIIGLVIAAVLFIAVGVSSVLTNTFSQKMLNDSVEHIPVSYTHLKNTYFRTEAVMLHLYMDCQDPENQRLHMRSMAVNMRSRYFTTMRSLSIQIHAHPSRSSLPILIRQQTIRQDARTINIF